MVKKFAAKDNKISNKCAAKCMCLMSLLVVFVWIANGFGIFDIDKNLITIVSIFNIALLLLPTFIIEVLKINDPFLGYVSVLCSGVVSCLLYSLLREYAVLLLIFPILMALTYFDKNMMGFSIAVCAVATISAQYIIENFTVSPVIENIYDSKYKLILYSIMTKIMDIIFLSICAVIIADKRYESEKEFVEKNIKLERRNACLSKLSSMSDYLYCSKTVYELMDASVEIVREVFNVWENEAELKSVVSALKNRNGKYNVVKMKERVIREFDRFIIIIDEDNDEKFEFGTSGEEIEIEGNNILMRFFFKDEFYGFMFIHADFCENELIKEIAGIIHNDMQTAYKNMRDSIELLQTEEDIIYTFASVCESKMNHSEQHIKRVAEYVRILAAGLGFSDGFCDYMRLASMMHDIGMLLVPSEVFDKPEYITDGERDIVKNHVEYGAEILSGSTKEVLKIAKFMAREHHEKWDGSGYLGMTGDEISIYGRIIAVADVFDALISEKIYKKAWDAAEAFEEITKKSGTWFDPAVVKVFEDNFTEILSVAKKYPD